MQIVCGNFTELGTEYFQLIGLIKSNEISILDKQTNKFYARFFKYIYFGECIIIDRFLPEVIFIAETKTIKLTIEV